jgi:hypothetical protein
MSIVSVPYIPATPNTQRAIFSDICFTLIEVGG